MLISFSTPKMIMKQIIQKLIDKKGPNSPKQFQSFSQGGAGWQAKRAEIFWHSPQAGLFYKNITHIHFYFQLKKRTLIKQIIIKLALLWPNLYHSCLCVSATSVPLKKYIYKVYNKPNYFKTF